MKYTEGLIMEKFGGMTSEGHRDITDGSFPFFQQENVPLN